MHRLSHNEAVMGQEDVYMKDHGRIRTDGDPIRKRRAADEVSEERQYDYRPVREWPNIPPLLIQAIFIDQEEDPSLAADKADRSLYAYVHKNKTKEGKQAFRVHAWRFLRVQFARTAYYRDFEAIGRLKAIATAMGASREFTMAYDLAEMDDTEGTRLCHRKVDD